MTDDKSNIDSQPQFALQRIYLKDISFESPKSPEIFKDQWTPEVKLDINTKNKPIKEENLYEVVLSVTVTVQAEKEVAFVIEVHQGGIFFISNLKSKELERTLNAFCPNILFPYVRETIDSMVVRGTFPPIMLAPVNFDLLYEKMLEKQHSASTVQ